MIVSSSLCQCVILHRGFVLLAPNMTSRASYIREQIRSLMISRKLQNIPHTYKLSRILASICLDFPSLHYIINQFGKSSRKVPWSLMFHISLILRQINTVYKYISSKYKAKLYWTCCLADNPLQNSDFGILVET